jgi:hypothetical protein
LKEHIEHKPNKRGFVRDVAFRQRLAPFPGAFPGPAGAALLVAFVTQEVSVWIVERGWSLVGPALAVWLVADAVDLGAPSTARSA